MYVGKKLKQLRQSLDLNQAEMSDNLGVSQPYYSAVEGGKKPLTNKMFNKIMVLYSLDITYFSENKDEKNGYNIGSVNKDENIPTTNSLEYYKRSYERFEIKKDSIWQSQNNAVKEKLQKVHFYYNKLIFVKELIAKELKIKVKTLNNGRPDLLAFERNIINNFGGEINYGSIRADNSTLAELRVFNNDLFDLINILELRFFELFQILYLGLDKSKNYKNPEFID